MGYSIVCDLSRTFKNYSGRDGETEALRHNCLKVVAQGFNVGPLRLDYSPLFHLLSGDYFLKNSTRDLEDNKERTERLCVMSC